MLPTRQNFSTNFIARWTLVITTFSTTRMLVAISHLFAFCFAKERFGTRQLFGMLTTTALFSNNLNALKCAKKVNFVSWDDLMYTYRRAIPFMTSFDADVLFTTQHFLASITTRTNFFGTWSLCFL